MAACSHGQSFYLLMWLSPSSTINRTFCSAINRSKAFLFFCSPHTSMCPMHPPHALLPSPPLPCDPQGAGARSMRASLGAPFPSTSSGGGARQPISAGGAGAFYGAQSECGWHPWGKGRYFNRGWTGGLGSGGIPSHTPSIPKLPVLIVPPHLNGSPLVSLWSFH